MVALIRNITIFTLLLFFVTGCGPSVPVKEKQVSIISDPPGAIIEINKEYIGKAPLSINIPMNFKGEFTRITTITATPTHAGQSVQAKVYSGGFDIASNDKVPNTVYFNMYLRDMSQRVNVNVYRY